MSLNRHKQFWMQLTRPRLSLMLIQLSSKKKTLEGLSLLMKVLQTVSWIRLMQKMQLQKKSRKHFAEILIHSALKWRYSTFKVHETIVLFNKKNLLALKRAFDNWWKTQLSLFPCSKVSMCHCLWQSRLHWRMEACHPRGSTQAEIFVRFLGL